MNRTSEKGAVAFYILLAIVLLAALTYAVSQGSRTGANSITEDQARLAASEILDYGNTVARAVQKLKLRGCSDTEISFQNNVVSGYTNGTNTACQVFHTDGGGINYIQPSELARWPGSDWAFSGQVPVSQIGSSEPELIMVLRMNDTAMNACTTINDKLGVSNVAGEPPTDDFSFGTKFTGTYSAGAGIGTAELIGQTTACTQNSLGGFHFYQVLLAR